MRPMSDELLLCYFCYFSDTNLNIEESANTATNYNPKKYAKVMFVLGKSSRQMLVTCFIYMHEDY